MNRNMQPQNEDSWLENALFLQELPDICILMLPFSIGPTTVDESKIQLTLLTTMVPEWCLNKALFPGKGGIAGFPLDFYDKNHKSFPPVLDVYLGAKIFFFWGGSTRPPNENKTWL